MKSYIPASSVLPEITLRACILSIFLTVVLMAANMYLALKVGMTFATTLPAAVISMAVLSRFKQSNILENTAVQTFASTGGASSSIVFGLPALIIFGTWSSFPYWQTTLISLLGGILGVFFTIPLRRALVVESEKDIPFPEGQAAAEVLKVGEHLINKDVDSDRGESGIRYIAVGTLLAAVMDFLTSGLKVASDSIGYATYVGKSALSMTFGFQLALVGAGYLIGFRLCLAMLAGTLFANWILIPYFSLAPHYQGMNLHDVLEAVYTQNIRFIGVGTIGMAALWSILLLLKPLTAGIVASIKDHRENKLSDTGIIRTEKDIPMGLIIAGVALITLPSLGLVAYFISTSAVSIAGISLISLVLLCVFLAIFIGFFMAAVAGYMAGIIGSSNSPISGLIYLTAVIMAFILSYASTHIFSFNADVKTTQHFIVGLVLFVVSFVLAMAAIANDNLQDLKTGQVVGATPWKQQVVLIMGVIVASMIVAPVFNLLYNAYGLQGAPLPHANMALSQTLQSPQANLAVGLVQGIVTDHSNWSMLLLGALIGIAIIALDFLFKALKWPRISVFSFSIAVYLPMALILPIVVGGVLSFFVHKQLKRRAIDEKSFEQSKTPGVLVASGLIVGEALMSIFIAGGIAMTGNQFFMAIVGPSFATAAHSIAVVLFIISIACAYTYMKKDFKL